MLIAPVQGRMSWSLEQEVYGNELLVGSAKDRTC